MKDPSYNAVVAQGRITEIQFPNRAQGWDVYPLHYYYPTPAPQPLAGSTAISATPVTHSNPTEGHQMSQESLPLTGIHSTRLPANDYYAWEHSPAVLHVHDEDGDSIYVNHVYVEDEAQVWITALGLTGQMVQVALDANALRQLGELLLDEASDAE